MCLGQFSFFVVDFFSGCGHIFASHRPVALNSKISLHVEILSGRISLDETVRRHLEAKLQANKSLAIGREIINSDDGCSTHALPR